MHLPRGSIPASNISIRVIRFVVVASTILFGTTISARSFASVIADDHRLFREGRIDGTVEREKLGGGAVVSPSGDMQRPSWPPVDKRLKRYIARILTAHNYDPHLRTHQSAS